MVGNATTASTLCALVHVPTPHPTLHRPLLPPSPDGGSGPVPRQLFLLWHLFCLSGLSPRQRAPLFQGVTLCWAPCQLVCWSGTHFESQNWSEAWRKGMGMGIRYHLQCVASHLCTSTSTHFLLWSCSGLPVTPDQLAFFTLFCTSLRAVCSLAYNMC